MKVLLLPNSIVEDTAKQLIKSNCLLRNLTASSYFIESVELFKKIHSSELLRPDEYTLPTILTACANTPGTVSFGDQLHAYTVQTGLKSITHVANSLISLYTKSKDLGSVKRVFGEISNPDVFSWTTLLSACTKLGEVSYACYLINEMPKQEAPLWNAIITGCAANGHGHIAVELFRKMRGLGIGCDHYVYASVLSLNLSELSGLGRQVHCLAIKTQFMCKISVVNALMAMYFDCGRVADAFKVFEGVDVAVMDQITYSTMINGLISSGMDEKALMLFKDMQRVGLRPNKLAFVSFMSSCLCAKEVCLQVHAQAIKLGYGCCTAVSNAAMGMYVDLQEINTAHQIFNELGAKDLVSWNTLIMGYSQSGFSKSVVLIYHQMQRNCVLPDEYTIGSLLGNSETLEFVQMVHAVVVKSGLDMISEAMNALVSALVKHGEIKEAYTIFSATHPKNLISWNAMISGLLFNGCSLQGLDQFAIMVRSKILPNVSTLAIILTICGSVPAHSHGKEVHGYIVRCGFQETSLDNALITMYAKCGDLNMSMKLFHIMSDQDIFSWNCLISALSQHGEGREAVKYFIRLLNNDGVRPDEVTFTAVLSACSHAGLVEEGIEIFNSMINKYVVKPGVDHFSCIVDLLGRAGYLDETQELIGKRSCKVDTSVWWALFSACAAYGNVKLGRIVAQFLLQRDKNDPTVYVMLSNIHASAGQWEQAARVREMMKGVILLKQPGCSWTRL